MIAYLSAWAVLLIFAGLVWAATKQGECSGLEAQCWAEIAIFGFPLR